MGQLVMRTLVGGTVSAATGGKFANGAASAAMAFAAGRAMGSSSQASDRDGSGEPSRASVADSAIYRNFDWLESGALTVNCQTSECILSLQLTVSFDPKWSDSEVFNWMAEIDYVWNTSTYDIAQGVRYTTRITLSFAAPNSRGDLHFGHEDIGFGNFAVTRLGTGVIRMNTPVSGTASHEFGHALGLRHLPNVSRGLMSYAPNRTLKPEELSRVFNAYRFPYSPGYR